MFKDKEAEIQNINYREFHGGKTKDPIVLDQKAVLPQLFYVALLDVMYV